MPSITGIHHVGLSVTDLDRSAGWYVEVLGFTVVARIDGNGFTRVRLRRADCPVILTLTCHDGRAGDAFDERRPGLDHLAFEVADVADVEAWHRHLTAAGVTQSGIQRTPDGAGARIAFRAPDGIQLELFGADDER